VGARWGDQTEVLFGRVVRVNQTYVGLFLPNLGFGRLVVAARVGNKGLDTESLTPLRCTLEILHTSSSAGAVDAVLQKNSLRLNLRQWTSVLNGLGWKKQGADRAVLVLRWMEVNGAAPDDRHYHSVMSAYEKGDNWEQLSPRARDRDAPQGHRARSRPHSILRKGAGASRSKC
jgi:hypothetical protein